MLAFESEDVLNPTSYNSLESLEERSGDTYNDLDQRGPSVQGPWRRELVVADLSMPSGRSRWSKEVGEQKSPIHPCDQQRCEKMQERLHQHVNTYHRGTKVADSDKKNEVGTSGKSPVMSPLISPHRSESDSVIAHSAQTDLNSINSPRLNSKNTSSKKAYEEQNHEAIPLRNSETQKLLAPKRNFYKQHLQDVIFKWYLKIPVFPTMNNKIKLKRLKVINELVDNIADLSSDIGNANYYEKLEHDVDICLDVLPMWYPGSKINKSIFKNDLCQLLLRRIENLNEKWLFIKNEDGNIFSATYDALSFTFDDDDDIEALRCEIANWVDNNLKITNDNIDNEIIIDIFLKRLIPILNIKSNRKEILRVEIMNILDDLSENFKFPKKRTTCFNKLAIDLADKVLEIIYKNKCGQIYTDEFGQNKILIIKHNDDGQQMSLHSDMESEEIANIHTLSEDSEEETFNEVADILYNSIDSALMRCNKGNCQDTVQDICEVLNGSGEFKYNDDMNLNMESQPFSGTLIVLTSEHDFSGPYDKGLSLTSTPLVPEQNKIPEKLNCAEKAYVKKVVNVVREWLNTIDMKFNTVDENLLKETISNDIAADVKDLAKLSQLQENMMMTYYEGVLTFIIMKAILKYGLLNTPPNCDTPQVVDLRERIIKVGMLDTIMSQHGNRQVIANVKFRCDNPTCTDTDFKGDEFISLEHNISVWLHEQPPNIYMDDNKERKHVLLRDVAKKVQEKIKNNASECEIKTDLKEWLGQIINPTMKKDIDYLAEDLWNNIIKLPQNETIHKAAQKRTRALAGEDTDLERKQDSVNTDIDVKLKHFIDTFIEHNYNVSDPLARGAFANILLQELLKLSPALRKEACNSIAQEEFNPDKFRRELEYIKEVSDWLKNIPFYPMLTSGNDRVEFVNGLAKNIADIEEERIKTPGKMDYDLMLHSNILEYMKQLPIPEHHIHNLVTCVNQLKERIAKHRPPTPCCLPMNSQLSTQSIKNDLDFAKFIEKFLDIHSNEIGDDQVKLEAYLARLLKEIKRIVLEKADTDILTSAQVHDRLADVPMPDKESVERFSTEMKYAYEVAEWLHNFPLIPLKSREEIESRMRMISELAEKMVETDLKAEENPNDPNAHAELENFIADWITKLHLYPNKEIVVPILISQLKNRMENVKKQSQKKEQRQKAVVQDAKSKPITRSNCKDKNYACYKATEVTKHENPGDLIVEAIESWCYDLPIYEEDEDSSNAAKEKVATNLFQKVGLLNVDPRVANDDLLYQDMLADEIEAELQNLSNYTEISNNKENLKTSFIDKVMDTKKVIKDMSAGENYKQALENTIDASLPNPIPISDKNDAGYELYKTRMAMLWLLENYDYATDFNSLKYKKKLNEEIEKYSDEAQKRNVFPMEKYEIFNEIFSALYKQNPPKESAIIDEVQNIKMRCEIDAWVKELPLKKSSGFQELLERDQILALLAKRLYDIEKPKYPDGEKKMHKEIMKWLYKLPILPDEKMNMSKYADKLICNLKITEDIRKCKREKVLNKTSEIQNNFNKSKNTLNITRKGNTSQIAGPSGLRPKPCCEGSSAPRKKAGDLITTAVETWCKQLPIISQNNNDKELTDHLKDEAIVKMYQILSDLHANPNILNNEGLYEHHLNIEIEKLLSELPGCCELQQTRNIRRAQLITELLAIRPLIKDELDREGFKQELKHAVSSFFEETTKLNKIVADNSDKDNVIDNFIEYSYHRDDYDDKQIYKSKINDVLADLLLKNQDNTQIDPLLTSNQLICKMSKVKPPKQSVLMDEVQEIEMKILVGDLLNEIEIPEHDKEKLMHRDQMKLVLAKKLIDIEKAGQNCANRQKMEAEITKVFKKLEAKVDPVKIYAFINHLIGNEDAKKASPPKEDSGYIQALNRSVPTGTSLVLRSPQQSFHHVAPAIPQSSVSRPQSPRSAQLQSTSPENSTSPSPSYPKGFPASTPKGPAQNIPNVQPGKSTYNQPPQSFSPGMDGSTGSRVAFRQPDQDRPMIVNGLPNAHLNPPSGTVEAGTRMTKGGGYIQAPNWSVPTGPPLVIGNPQQNFHHAAPAIPQSSVSHPQSPSSTQLQSTSPSPSYSKGFPTSTLNGPAQNIPNVQPGKSTYNQPPQSFSPGMDGSTGSRVAFRQPDQDQSMIVNGLSNAHLHPPSGAEAAGTRMTKDGGYIQAPNWSVPTGPPLVTGSPQQNFHHAAPAIPQSSLSHPQSPSSTQLQSTSPSPSYSKGFPTSTLNGPAQNIPNVQPGKSTYNPPPPSFSPGVAASTGPRVAFRQPDQDRPMVVNGLSNAHLHPNSGAEAAGTRMTKDGGYIQAPNWSVPTGPPLVTGSPQQNFHHAAPAIPQSSVSHPQSPSSTQLQSTSPYPSYSKGFPTSTPNGPAQNIPNVQPGKGTYYQPPPSFSPGVAASTGPRVAFRQPDQDRPMIVNGLSNAHLHPPSGAEAAGTRMTKDGGYIQAPNWSVPTGPPLVMGSPQQNFHHAAPAIPQSLVSHPQSPSSTQLQSTSPSPSYSKGFPTSTPNRPAQNIPNFQPGKSTYNQPPPSFSPGVTASAGPRVDFRQPDQDRPMIVNGLSNAHLHPLSGAEAAGTRMTKDGGYIQAPNWSVPTGPPLVMGSPQQNFHHAAPAIPQSSVSHPQSPSSTQLQSTSPSPSYSKGFPTSTPNGPAQNIPNVQPGKSTYNQPPPSFSTGVAASASPRVAFRQPDQDRPMIVNGLSNAHLHPPSGAEAAGSRMTKDGSYIQAPNWSVPTGPPLVMGSPQQNFHHAAPAIPQSSLSHPQSPHSTQLQSTSPSPSYSKVFPTSTPNGPAQNIPNVQPGKSTYNETPQSFSPGMDGSTGSRVAFRQPDQDRPIIVNGLPNAHLNPPSKTKEAGTRMTEDSGYIQAPNWSVPAGPPLIIRSPQQSLHHGAPVIPQSSVSRIQPPRSTQLHSTSPEKSISPTPSYPKGFSTSTPNGSAQNITNLQSGKRTYNQPPQSFSPGMDGSTSPMVSLRQSDTDRPVIAIMNRSSKAHLNPPSEPEEAGKRMPARIHGSPQDPNKEAWSSLGNNPQRSAGTIIEAENFKDCKCRRNQRMQNCKGVCKATTVEYCDGCKNDRDCEHDCDVYSYPIPGFIFL